MQITDIFDFYLLRQNQDLMQNFELHFHNFALNLKFPLVIFSATHLKNLRMHVCALTRAHIMIVNTER